MKLRLVRCLMGLAIVGGTLLGLSGQWTDPWLWAYIGTMMVVLGYAMFSIDEDLARERFHPPDPGADRVPLLAIRLLALSHLVIGALDTGRLHLTSVPPVLRVAGLIGLVLSCLFIFRAMLANRFFSPVVRIQTERGHRVVMTGPYAVIRHPGYAGMILMAPFSGLALGSWLSVALALAYSLMVLRRVMFEDAFLRHNLDGYEAYARQVRYRLVPGVF